MHHTRTRLAAAAVTLAIAAAATSCGNSSEGQEAAEPQTTRFEQANSDCEGKASNGAYNEVPGVSVEDDGATLIMDSKPEGIEGIGCVLGTLGTPSSIVDRVSNTTAMMGELTDEADGITYRWTYHPDNGLHLVLTDGDA